MNSTSIFDWLQMVAGNVWIYGGTFLLVLGILVFVHEWGHYIVARMCGVRIESFSIGFGPELFGFSDKRGTRWKFSLVPLGGYVKMFGDLDPASAGHSDKVEDKDTHEKRSLTEAERKEAFFAQPVGRRAAIVFAGPAINFIFAIILMTGLFTIYGEPVIPPVAAGVIAGSAAEAAGFQPYDEVIAIDGKQIHRFDDIRTEVMVGLDTLRDFTVRRDGKIIDIKATPKRKQDKDRFGFSHASAQLGLVGPTYGIDIGSILAVDGQKADSLDQARDMLKAHMGRTFQIQVKRGQKDSDTYLIHPSMSDNKALDDQKSPDYSHLILFQVGKDTYIVHHTPVEAFSVAVRLTVEMVGGTFKVMGQMISGVRSASEMGGIIRIGAMAGDMAKQGFFELLDFTAILSINLGLINLFPIPMLDGGHLLFYGIESIKGSPISEQIQEYAFRLGLAILVGIMLFANLNDIVQLIL